MSFVKAGALLSAIILPVLFIVPMTVSAQSPAELQAQINENNAQIEQLNKEIAQYQAQLDTTTKAKNTLQNKVAQLDLQRKKLNASISVTKKQISTTQTQIKQLANGIDSKQSSIEGNRAGLAESIRVLSQAEDMPLSLSLLSAANISDAWQDVDAIANIQDAVHADILRLAVEKQSLTETKDAAEAKRAQLLKEQSTLAAQQGSLDATRRAQAELLAETKSQESIYQKILAQKESAKASFEAALEDLKVQFQQAVDPSQITPAGKGVLRYPLDNVRITQYFGNTPFALAGAYNGKGHNGMDFAAPIGSTLRASLSGTVLATGNTDATRGCYSFGKWVMIKHNNGLNTMYAHLSQINVSSGQGVSTGQIIGYSGETGYATGPHLHFGVYVTSATRIIKLGEATNKKTACSNVTMPVTTSIQGYLNPLDYL
jgi:murein DD-endopeptidase MepM/ murein hydrolase activator NlpD